MADARLPEMNSLAIAGRLTADPDVRHTPSGTAIAKFALASDRRFKKGEKWETDTLFLECTLFGKSAESAAERFGKGDPILVEGRLQQDNWEDRNGGGRRSRIVCIAHRVHALSWPADKGELKYNADPQTNDDTRYVKEPVDDDLPF